MFKNLDASDIAQQVRQGQVQASDVAQDCLANIAQLNPHILAFVQVWDDVMEQAHRLDQRRQAGETLGPLAGVPIGIKDNLCVSGKICSCASKMLANYHPTYSASVVKRLQAADALLVGRTNMDEFAMGSGTEYSIYGVTKNPTFGNLTAGKSSAGNRPGAEAEAENDADYSPGGSSGGSAAAVAAGMVPLALGSDTGGSIRQPAAFCGVYGMKPTYGRVSRFGLVAFASSLDQVGPFARTPRDLALLFEAIAGSDPHDATCLSDEFVRAAERQHQRPATRPLRVGLIREHVRQQLSPSVQQALEQTIQRFESAGVEIREIPMPHQDQAIAAYYVVASCEAASNLSRYDGLHFGHRARNLSQDASLEETIAASRGEGFGAEVKRRIMLGTYALSHGYADRYYQQASRMRQAIRQSFQDAFQHVDVLLGPTTPAPAFQIGQHRHDPTAMYLTDQFTVSANLAGVPAISIPVTLQGEASGRQLPVAVQIHAPACGERLLLELARFLHSPSDLQVAL